MLQVENDSGEANSSSIGVMIPPPDIRSMVEKAARFVASKRPRLEKFIAMNAGMRKYSFLSGADPYHAYYQHLLSEFRAQNGSDKETRPTLSTDDPNAAVVEWILDRRERFEEGVVVCDTVVVSPITGELVTYIGMSEHMKDPKHKEQKERLFAKIREITHAQDHVISRSILEVARISPDSFGTTEEEVCNAVKAEIEITSPVLFSDWPELKKQRLLVPEDEGPVCISGSVPDKETSVDPSLSDSVSSLKKKIAGLQTN